MAKKCISTLLLDQYWQQKAGKIQLSFIHGKFEGRKMPSTAGLFVYDYFFYYISRRKSDGHEVDRYFFKFFCSICPIIILPLIKVHFDISKYNNEQFLFEFIPSSKF